ncbi:ABC transporter substrate-binding protein [bacterium]|nr:ABC transporter substrate-binding protein [bacterium]
MKTLKWHLLPILLIIFALGCSDDTDDTTDENANSIKIGVILPFSGESSAYGSSEMQGIQMALDEINEAGGIMNKPIELIVCDSRSDPFQASLAAKDLVDNENVVAIFGADASPVSIAIRDMIADENIIQISGSSGAHKLTNDDVNDSIFFRTVLSDYYQARVIADKLAALNDSMVRVLYVDDDYGNGMAETFENRFNYYGTVEKMISYELGKVSYAVEIESLFADVDTFASSQRTIFLIGYPKSGAQIIRDWKASGYSANWILSDAFKAQEFIVSAGAENAEGLMGVSPYYGDIDYEYFKDDYEDFTGQDSRKHRDIENWYDATILFAYAIIYADTLDPYFIGKALQIISSPPGTTITYGEFSRGKAIINTTTVIGTLLVRGDINYEGASGSVDIDNNGDIEDARYELWKIENGQFIHIEELRP